MSKSVIVYGVNSPYMKKGKAYEVSEAIAKSFIEKGYASLEQPTEQVEQPKTNTKKK